MYEKPRERLKSCMYVSTCLGVHFLEMKLLVFLYEDLHKVFSCLYETNLNFLRFKGNVALGNVWLCIIFESTCIPPQETECVKYEKNEMIMEAWIEKNNASYSESL